MNIMNKIHELDKWKEKAEKLKNNKFQESVVDIKLAIYESELSEKITSEERQMLLNKIQDINESTLNHSELPDDKPILIFDIGGVMMKSQSKQIAYKLLKTKWSKTGLTEEGVYELSRIFHEFNKNNEMKLLNEKDARELYKSMLPSELVPYADEVFDIMTVKGKCVDRCILQKIKSLKSRGYKIYYLSNVSLYSYTIRSKNHLYDFTKIFNGGLYSFEAGCRKPDLRIYDKLLKKYKLKAEQCIFFDDNPKNITAANLIGMKGILYTGQEVLDNAILYESALNSFELPNDVFISL